MKIQKPVILSLDVEHPALLLSDLTRMGIFNRDNFDMISPASFSFSFSFSFLSVGKGGNFIQSSLMLVEPPEILILIPDPCLNVILDKLITYDTKSRFQTKYDHFLPIAEQKISNKV